MAWGISGWSGGPRTPVSYNLRAGQFRGMGRPVVFNQRIDVRMYGAAPMQNHCCGGHYDCGGGGKMSFLEKLMVGLGLGAMVAAPFLGGGKKAEVADEVEQPKDQPKAAEPDNSKLEDLEKRMSTVEKENAQKGTDIKNLSKLLHFKNENPGINVNYENGKFVLIDKDGNKVLCDSLDDEAIKKAVNEKDEVEAKPDNEGDGGVVTSTLKDGDAVMVRDEGLYGRLGAKSDVKGAVQNNADGSFTITAQSGKKFTYDKVDGKTVEFNGKQYQVYTLKGATENGKTLSTNADEYIMVGNKLVQPKELKDELKGYNTSSVNFGGGAPSKKADSTEVHYKDKTPMLATDQAKIDNAASAVKQAYTDSNPMNRTKGINDALKDLNGLEKKAVQDALAKEGIFLKSSSAASKPSQGANSKLTSVANQMKQLHEQYAKALDNRNPLMLSKERGKINAKATARGQEITKGLSPEEKKQVQEMLKNMGIEGYASFM